MRALPLALLVLCTPIALASTAAQDEPGDERIVLPVANAVKLDPTAGAVGCRAPAVDIVLVSADVESNVAVLRFRVVDIGAAPSCGGRALQAADARYLLDLENEDYSLLNRGGDDCASGWSCMRIARHGEGSYVDTIPGATGVVEGNEWTLRVPLSGRTTTGRIFDLRGETFTVHAYAEQTEGPTGLLFSDSATGVATLR